MNTNVGPPEIGQWYAVAGKGELFLVVARDDDSRTIEIQNYDGDIDEIDAETWGTLALERTEQPEDWTAPMDDVETDDLNYSETAMAPRDWAQPLQPLQMGSESWEDTEAEDERDALGEGVPVESFTPDIS